MDNREKSGRYKEKMKMYHGTTEESWKQIQEEGALWGRKNRFWCGREMDRITWLAKKIKHAGIYNDEGITKESCVMLEVDMPEVIKMKDWQYTTYDPIPISRIKRIK